MYNNLNDLNEFSDLKNFKSYEDLKKRLDYVLGHKGTPKFQDQETVEEDRQWEAERRKGDFSESTLYNAPQVVVVSMILTSHLKPQQKLMKMQTMFCLISKNSQRVDSEREVQTSLFLMSRGSNENSR